MNVRDNDIIGIIYGDVVPATIDVFHFFDLKSVAIVEKQCLQNHREYKLNHQSIVINVKSIMQVTEKYKS